MGNLSHHNDDFATAKAYYETVLEKSYIDPLATDETVGRIHGGLGNLAFLDEEYQEAEDAYDRAISYQPEFPANYLSRGDTKLALGDITGLDDYEYCVQLINADEERGRRRTKRSHHNA
jgi:tetratricopeptide (TPR) repeat protein